MTPPRPYRFSAVPASSLSPFDREDPFRFYRDQEPPPVHSAGTPTSIILEAFDKDGNRRLTPEDEFYYLSDTDRRLRMTPQAGLQIFNYYVDPPMLWQKRLRVL